MHHSIPSHSAAPGMLLLLQQDLCCRVARFASRTANTTSLMHNVLFFRMCHVIALDEHCTIVKHLGRGVVLSPKDTLLTSTAQKTLLQRPHKVSPQGAVPAQEACIAGPSLRRQLRLPFLLWMSCGEAASRARDQARNHKEAICGLDGRSLRRLPCMQGGSGSHEPHPSPLMLHVQQQQSCTHVANLHMCDAAPRYVIKPTSM